MQLDVLEGEFVVCKVANADGIKFDSEYCFYARTPDEISLVCKRDDVPAQVESADGGWRALRVAGTLDFSLVGIMSKLSTILADAGVSIFAVSTYNTDYILVRRQLLEKAKQALRDNGYTLA